MYLVGVWVFPAGPEFTRDRIAHEVDRQILETSVAHVFLCERSDWLIIGVFLNGSAPDDADRDLDRVRLSLASMAPDRPGTTILAELMPLEPIAGLIHDVDGGINYWD